MSRIFVVGSYAVGSATGIPLDRAGHEVTFVDPDGDRVVALRALGYDAQERLDLEGEPASFVFLCPPTAGENGFDLRGLERDAVLTGRALAGAQARHIVAVRCAVPPGTTAELVRPLLEQWSGRPEGIGFGLAACPDLGPVGGDVAPEGAGVTVVGARTERVAHRLAGLLEPLAGEVRLFADPAAAELVRCASSLFNATKISFWNEMWGACRRLGIDPDQIDEVADTVADAARGSVDPSYGLRGGAPYGGEQLPADTAGFLGFAAELGISMPLLSAVIGVNTAFSRHLEEELSAGLPVTGGRCRPPRRGTSPRPLSRIPRQLRR